MLGHRRSPLTTGQRLLRWSIQTLDTIHYFPIVGFYNERRNHTKHDQYPSDQTSIPKESIALRFVCAACGKRGADVRPDFDWDKDRALRVGY
jgi:hypothetical protein